MSSNGDEHGVLDETSWEGEISQGDCYNGQSMSWKGVTAASGWDEHEKQAYDQIKQGLSNVWRFDLHFPDRPKEMLSPCSKGDEPSYWARPSSFNYVLSVVEEDEPYVLMSGPDPSDGDGESGNDELGFALDIISSYGGTYTALGAAVGKYIMSGSGGTNVDQEDNQRTWTWDVSVSGDYYDLPREENDKAKAAQVSINVENNGMPADDFGMLEFLPEYSFTYYKLDPTNCDCSQPWPYIKTTVPDYNIYPAFDSIE